MTTAPDLDRPFSAAILPPLPSSSSGSKHRRALISIPSAKEPQRPSSAFGRANAMTNQSEVSYGSLLSRPDSLLSDSDSQFRHCKSMYVKPELDRNSVLSRAYLPRRSILGMPTNAADESTASLQNPSVVPGRVVTHSRTASAPSMPCSSGKHTSSAFRSSALEFHFVMIHHPPSSALDSDLMRQITQRRLCNITPGVQPEAFVTNTLCMQCVSSVCMLNPCVQCGATP